MIFKGPFKLKLLYDSVTKQGEAGCPDHPKIISWRYSGRSWGTSWKHPSFAHAFEATSKETAVPWATGLRSFFAGLLQGDLGSIEPKGRIWCSSCSRSSALSTACLVRTRQALSMVLPSWQRLFHHSLWRLKPHQDSYHLQAAEGEEGLINLPY